jgi:2-dehydro-3-deoxyphosphogluconate aldolase/(4S)-4-hydroxy-2-oxoglutarate aldolase
MKAAFSDELFQKMPIVGILRGCPLEKLRPIVEAFQEGGLFNLEITMNSTAAAEQIKVARGISGGGLNIGAGTVTSLMLLEQALAAGATFIVTPTVSVPVIKHCVQNGVPVFPGAFSPTEILQAWELGATMVKVFPAEVLGASYIKNIKAPLPHVRLMPTGGVDQNSLSAFAKAGADAFGIGSPLFRPERVAANDWEWLRNQCRGFVEAFRTRNQ